ncbi:polysaccharide lyase family 7 protein [Cellvibrio sp. KY-GH-1]|uniref:polysaccharide lyase family 7 protein n=1 Tax=Cellvibrio sp. KY-GH-1 TaxID=2303332 RepID=UPI0017825A4C|nr:polysaccharide lyase family 7 protein [Cellvibrio sp. KY-GH-1]
MNSIKYCLLLSLLLISSACLSQSSASSSSSSSPVVSIISSSVASISAVSVSSVAISYTAQAVLQGYFSTEGLSPYVFPGQLKFSAMDSQWVTPTANGWRNELKLKTKYRKSMYETSEKIKARISIQVSPGAKTIILQCHDGGAGALVKIFLADMVEVGNVNNIALDGIFDVYARVKGTDGVERKFPLGTVRSGEGFDFEYQNDYGQITIIAFGRTVRTMVYDGSSVYLKYGSYLQAQHPVTQVEVDNPDDFAAFYLANGITQDIIKFQNLTYTHN